MSDEQTNIDWFAIEMKRKLTQNLHKGGWGDCRFDYLLGRLRAETDELLYSHIKYRLDTHMQAKVITDQQVKDLVGECADVANFAMMIADNFKRMEREK